MSHCKVCGEHATWIFQCTLVAFILHTKKGVLVCGDKKDTDMGSTRQKRRYREKYRTVHTAHYWHCTLLTLLFHFLTGGASWAVCVNVYDMLVLAHSYSVCRCIHSLGPEHLISLPCIMRWCVFRPLLLRPVTLHMTGPPRSTVIIRSVWPRRYAWHLVNSQFFWEAALGLLGQLNTYS